MADTLITLPALKHYDEKIKEVIDEKQDQLVGIEGQVVSFDADGNVIAKDLEKVEFDTSNLVEKEEGKGLFSGSYNDLTDKPEIPSIDSLVSGDTLNTTLSGYAKKSDIPTSLPASDVFDWAKSETKPKYTADEIGADASGSANQALSDAKDYTDEKIDALVGEGASTTLDTIGEISKAIEDHKDVTDALNSAIGNKANTSDLTSHTGNTTVHITSTERTNWNDANSKKHSHSNKTVLDNTTASFTTEEKNKLTGIEDGANAYTLPSAGTSLGGVKTGGDVTITEGVITVNDDSHNHTIDNVDGLQSALDGKASTSHGTHVSYSTTKPVMDGTASVGSATTVSRSDHKHPTDTSRASASDLTSHIGNTTSHITSTERTNWNAAKTHADSTHAPSTAEKNVIVGIQKNGTDVTVNSSTRKVNITVPTKMSELTNDSGYAKTSDIPSAYDDTALSSRVSKVEKAQQTILGNCYNGSSNITLSSDNVKKMFFSTTLTRDQITAGASIDFYTLLKNSISDFSRLLGASFIGFNTGSGPGGPSTNKNFIVGNYYISEDNYALFKGNGEYGSKWIDTFEIKNTNLSTASYSSQSYNLFFEVYYVAS